MKKQVIFDKEVKEAIIAGCDIVAKAVGSTHGPAGNNVILDVDSLYPRTTKDGVSVARELFFLEDKYQRLAAQILINAAVKQLQDCGDGTTCTIVMADQIIKKGLKAIENHNPTRVRNGINRAKNYAIAALDEIKKNYTNFEELKAVATISTNNDYELGDIIAKAVYAVGKHGLVSYEKSIKDVHEVEYSTGYQWQKGIDSQYFFTDHQKFKTELDEPFILVTDKTISWISDIMNICNQVAEYNKTYNRCRSLLIIADQVKDEAIAVLAENNINKKFPSCTIQIDGLASRKKDNLQDLAIYTGAKFISEDRGLRLQDVKLTDLGSCTRFVSGYGAGSKSFIYNNNDKTGDYIQSLKDKLEKSEDDIEKKELTERIARLESSIAVIKVSGKTETEQKELLDKVDDAIRATKAAQEDGIVPGGGVAYLMAKLIMYKLADELYAGQGEDEIVGIKIILDVLESSFRNIMANANLDNDCNKIIEEIYREQIGGYDAMERQPIDDMYKRGIVDPVKVAKNALLNAVSVACLLLVSNTMIITGLEKEDYAR